MEPVAFSKGHAGHIPHEIETFPMPLEPGAGGCAAELRGSGRSMAWVSDVDARSSSSEMSWVMEKPQPVLFDGGTITGGT